MKKGLLRILAGIILFVAAVTLPPYVTIIFAAVCIFYFDAYIEAIFAGLVVDSVFGAVRTFETAYGFFYTTLFGVILLTITILKPRLRWYQ